MRPWKHCIWVKETNAHMYVHKGCLCFRCIVVTCINKLRIMVMKIYSMWLFSLFAKYIYVYFLRFLSYVDQKDWFFSLSLATRILTAVGEAAISATTFPLGAQQFKKENEGKAVVRKCLSFLMRSISMSHHFPHSLLTD